MIKIASYCELRAQFAHNRSLPFALYRSLSLSRSLVVSVASFPGVPYFLTRDDFRGQCRDHTRVN